MGLIGPACSLVAAGFRFFADLLDKENSKAAITAKLADQHQALKDQISTAVASGDLETVRKLLAQ